MPNAPRTFNSKHLTFDIRSIVTLRQTQDDGERSRTINGQLSMVRKASGFTLIELLIVISIIGILASLTVASFANAQAKGRDTRRKADLDALKKALELARQDTPGAYYYPATTTPLAPTYIKTLPTDPKTQTNYTYTPSPASCAGNCTTYSLVACLENTSDPAKDTAQNDAACPDSPVSYTITPN